VAFDPLARLTVMRTLLASPHGVNEDHIGNGGLVERRTEYVHAFVRSSMDYNGTMDERKMRIVWVR